MLFRDAIAQWKSSETKDIARIVHKDGHYYSVRNDTPGEWMHEISLNAVIDLMKNLQRYEHDHFKEQHNL